MVKSKANKKRSKPVDHFSKLDGVLTQTLDRYFKTLSGHKTGRLYHLVNKRVEKLLLEYILKKTDYHLSQTAKILGISRATLRNKMTNHKMGKKIPASGKK